MRTPAQIAGHPIHPMLVTIPIGLWLFSLVADLIAMRSGSPETWAAAALYTMVGGIIGALAAALPGFIDLLSLGDNPIKKTAVMHMSINLTVVALYAVNAWTRYHPSVSPTVSLALSVIGIAMLLVSGWLGGKMVYEAGVAVHPEDAGLVRSGEWAGYGTARSQSFGTGAAARRGEHAFAKDSTPPSRDMGLPREDRASATRSSDTPRE